MSVKNLGVIGMSACMGLGLSACKNHTAHRVVPVPTPPTPPTPAVVPGTYSISAAACEGQINTTPGYGSVTIDFDGVTTGDCLANFIYYQPSSGSNTTLLCAESVGGTIVGNSLELRDSELCGLIYDPRPSPGWDMQVYVTCDTADGATPRVYFADAVCDPNG